MRGKNYLTFSNLIKLDGKKDLWIREDVYPAVALPFNRTKGKNLVIVYHIDSSQSEGMGRIFDKLMEKIFYLSLKKADAILTISEFWQNHFQSLGYENVYRIYVNFDLNDFNISQEEVVEFKKKYGLEGKSIIYIGNCQKSKGAVESYNALKDLNVFLVTSGIPFVDIPAMNLNLKYRDYLTLLKASSVAVTMSKFREGWNMTAHEAMLVKTPVIGSGFGGMKELLEGGKQIICPDFSSLKEKVENLLANPETRKEMGEQGYDFAKNFTRERFTNDWIALIKKIANE